MTGGKKSACADKEKTKQNRPDKSAWTMRLVGGKAQGRNE
jgi:hypothetical protein